MLFQPSNIAPSTLSGIGAGTVDATQGITVSWQVNGDTPMTAYQITIYQNDTNSTQKYTTGKISLSTPFQTHDKNGNPRFFSTQISASNLSSAGIVNGYANGYKLLIKEWWSSNDYVEQTSASVFYTKKNPTLTINTISGTSMSETITASYSQAQGDPISTVEWIFAVAGSESTPIKRTGTVTTQMLEFDADGLMDGVTYSIECNVVTASGVDVSTGFIQFTVSYSITNSTASWSVMKLTKSSAVGITWATIDSSATSYEVYRDDGVSFLRHVATTGTALSLRRVLDYSVASQNTVSYLIFSMNGSTPTKVLRTGTFTPVFWDYSVLLATEDSDGFYHVNSEYRFGLNVETAEVSNNNTPTLQTNFTPYPNRQPISSLYKSGTLKSYIGTVGNDKVYTDSISLQNAIYNISTSTLYKFLKTRKGDLIRIETSGPIKMQTLDASPLQPLYATIDWVEVADSSTDSVISLPTDSFWPFWS